MTGLKITYLIILMPLLILLNGCIIKGVEEPSIYRDRGSDIKTEYRRLIRRFNKKEYDSAIRLSMKMIERYPGANLISDVQWIMALSYEYKGDTESALKEYRLFIENFPESTHVKEAKQKISKIQRSRGRMPEMTHAILFHPKGGYSYEELEKVILSLKGSGIDTIVLQVYNRERGVYFKTDNAPVIEDILTPIAGFAHNQGMQVFALMAIRDMNWIVKDRQGWQDRYYDIKEDRLISYQRLDILNPDVQRYILVLYRDLVSSNIDGIYFYKDLIYTRTEGFGIMAMDLFREDFGYDLDPVRLYRDISKDKAGVSHVSFHPDFWKWIGWKNRKILGFIGRVMKVSRDINPDIRFVIALNYESITDPGNALIEYTQDILEAKRYNFDYYLLSSSSSDYSTGKDSISREEVVRIIIKRGRRLLDDPDRLLIEVNKKEKDYITFSTSHLYSVNTSLSSVKK